MRVALLLVLSAWLGTGPLFAAASFQGKSQEEIVAEIDAVVAKKKAPAGFGAALAGLLTSSTAGIRAKERAAWAIGELEYKNGAQALLKAADHKGLLVRSAALASLARLRPAAALPVFARVAQSDPILQLRQRATVALGLYRSDKAIEPLVKLSSDPAPEVRGAAAIAMAMMQSKKNDFTELLAEMATDESAYVKERAERALSIARGKPGEVVSALKTGDSDIRLAAAATLERTAGEKQLPALKDAWNGEADDDVREVLERAIVSTKRRVKEEQARRAAERKAKAAAAAAAEKAKSAPAKPAKKGG